MEVAKRKKILILLILIIGFILIIWLGYTIYNATTFHIVSTNPSINNVATVSPFIDVNFNRALSNKINVTSNPNIVSSFKIINKQIDISLNIPLNENYKYTILISDIYDTSGQHLNNQKLAFTPIYISASNLPQDQGKVLLKNQANYSKSTYGNNLTQLLPFTEPNLQYQINYESNKGKLTFLITASNQQNQQAALDWIKAQGYNPSQLNIKYIIGQPQ